MERLLGADVFRLPALAGGLRRVRELAERGERDAAAAMLARLGASFPQAQIVPAARAVLLEGKLADQTAMEALAVLLAPVQVACPTAGPGEGPGGETAGGPAASPEAKSAPEAASEGAGAAPPRASSRR